MKKYREMIVVASVSVLLSAGNIGVVNAQEEEELQMRPNPIEKTTKGGSRTNLDSKMKKTDPSDPVVSPTKRTYKIDPSDPVVKPKAIQGR